MASFVQFLQNSGVFAAQNFMIVPREGFNLVCLRDSKDVGLSYDRNRLLVEDVRLDDVERVAQEYIKFRFREQKGQERDDQLLRLRTALYATARPDGPARGLKVSPKDKGIPELKAIRGNASIKLDVAILPRKDFTVAFKFLKRLDQSGKVINATKWTPDDVPSFLTKLNWTFGAQANIFFTPAEATWITVQKALAPKIPRDVFRKDIVPLKGRGADLTCFLVGDYDAKDNEAAGEYLPDEQVCVVVDQGNPPVFDYGEAFIGVMAHEFGHFLHHKRNMPGSGHHDRSGILLSSGMESLSLDRQLVSNFNAW
ncbi:MULTISPECIES: hypothetical protein [unclassified Bradyrhizobium]|uniref:hypothetical protein n=1 Tax=unclassified Bradyrhizobium TaxID=2631580 RepID=UPI001409B220|nr:hypothetical protein [Bradyrhizobium sp. 2S1]MCK7668836.1 hypothetical protein [Bradyrhizobium sp. 2S1]